MDKSNRWINVMDVMKKPIDKIKEYREELRSPKSKQIWIEERLKDLTASINLQLNEKGCDNFVKKWIDEMSEVKNML